MERVPFTAMLVLFYYIYRHETNTEEGTVALQEALAKTVTIPYALLGGGIVHI